MEVRVNQSRSGLRMLPWVGECSERSPGDHISNKHSPRSGRQKYCAPTERGNLVWRDPGVARSSVAIWNHYAVAW